MGLFSIFLGARRSEAQLLSPAPRGELCDPAHEASAPAEVVVGLKICLYWIRGSLQEWCYERLGDQWRPGGGSGKRGGRHWRCGGGGWGGGFCAGPGRRGA